MVPNLYQDGVGTLHPGSDDQFLRSISYGFHRFNSVEEKIEDYLLQLHAIPECRWQTLFQIGFNNDLFSHRLIVDQAKHFFDNFIDVQRNPLESSLFEK